MNAASVVATVIIAILVAAAIAFHLHRRRKRGTDSCNGCTLRSYCSKH